MQAEGFKISIVTAAYNVEETIRDTLLSVARQTYKSVEHIIVDGASTDRTLEVVNEFDSSNTIVISEPDEGLYDAMNKGLRRATGDVVAFLNADDYFADANVLASVASAFEDRAIDCVFGNVVIVDNGQKQRARRYYKAPRRLRPSLRLGHMPPHPATFIRTRRLVDAGGFNTSYKICGDFEILVRLVQRGGISFSRLPKILSVMRMGGVSTSGLTSTRTINREMAQACRENGLSTHTLLIWCKYMFKWLQYVEKPPCGYGPPQSW